MPSVSTHVFKTFQATINDSMTLEVSPRNVFVFIFMVISVLSGVLFLCFSRAPVSNYPVCPAATNHGRGSLNCSGIPSRGTGLVN